MKARRWMALAGAAVIAAALGTRVAADEKGDALLKSAFGKLHAAKSFSANVEQTVKTPEGERRSKGRILAMKPNYFRFELEAQGAPIYVSDGTNYFNYTRGRPNYMKMPIEKNAKQMMGPWEGEVDAFFGGAEAGEKSEAAVTGSEKVNGIDSHLLTVKMKNPDRTVVYAVGKEDMKIHRSVLTIPIPDGKEFVQTNTLTDIKVDPTLSAADFAFKAPAGVTEFVRQDPNAKLIPVGNKAPEFSLPTPTGNTISLKDGLSRKKALLVNFWFYN